VEREINHLLRSGSKSQQAVRPADSQPTSSADRENSAESGAGVVPQRDISEDDVCPICQDELLAKHQPVTFCRSDFVSQHWFQIKSHQTAIKLRLMYFTGTDR